MNRPRANQSRARGSSRACPALPGRRLPFRAVGRSVVETRRTTSSPFLAAGFALSLVLPLAGCKTDLNQQLLERELRMQEDQIYRLQDELASKSARLERAVGENASLKRQLGVGDSAAAPRSVLPAPAGSSGPTFVPPPRIPSSPSTSPATGSPGAAPGGLRFAPPAGGASPLPAPTTPPSLAPPSLDGVPPLPGVSSGMAPAVRRLSFEESVAGEGRITHLVINPAKTVCFDGDGDGIPEGLALVVEPRDADERMVTAAGDLVVFVNDPAVAPGTAFAPPEPSDPGEGGCVARWEIPEAEALAHFRRTSRARGIHLLLRWPGPPPRSATVHVHAHLTTFDGSVHRVDAPVSVAGGAPDTGP